MIWTGFVVGMALGFVVQRGRFCTVALVRESVLKRPVALYGVAIIVLLQAIGVHGLAALKLVSLEEVAFQPISAIVGGLLFGGGMIVAGFCPATMWVRSGEGILAAWVALGMFMIGVESAKAGAFKTLYNWLRTYEVEQAYIYGSLGIGVWWLVAGLAIVCIAWIVRALRRPEPQAFRMQPEFSGLRHVLFEARWHPALTAALIGAIAVLAWPLAVAAGRTTGVAFSGPSGNLLSLVVSGKPALHWGILFVLGVLSGGFAAARGANEFRWRAGDSKVFVRAASGGFAMGLGSAIASGCIISHCFINASLFLWQGVVAGSAILLGAVITVYWLYKKPSSLKDRP